MKTSLIAATLLSASMMSSAVSAQESVLQTLLTDMVTTAVSVTANEISADVYQTVANTSYHFELDGKNSGKSGSVSVTDLVVSTDAAGSSNEEDAD
ncbi:hypothetical protein LHL20_12225 [Alteromonas sp. McT4-15]|jgi:hypothetical protein|uniref:hypothetical protein n=1 Tax=unclassified Alteromonas TaxID=2614992 RepID=UPI001922408A|nr:MULTISPECIES: hypothetical protein [unclassified Alteromonas]MEC8230836.1 hypothetical protein [Pseudomonadota bacterium]MCB4436992.1 hypothetical protein [Alteromonas sp. McT4-15]WDT85486.1 hypothetical protein OZ660_16345 [Alteromonas sp. 009811495]BCO20425.1 hypothetical protein KUC3_32820 [Alteromonas sp. KC3]BCO24391.1 hypothetical protein KUC14_32600 [Alteromonas sp. KC14]